MALMRVFENFISEFKDSFESCNTTKALINTILLCIVTLPRKWISLFTSHLEPFVKYEISHLEEVLLECPQADLPSEYKLF